MPSGAAASDRTPSTPPTAAPPTATAQAADVTGPTHGAHSSGLGVAAVLAATLCWASAGVLAKKADLPGTVLAFWRLLIVAAVFALLTAVTKRRVTRAMLRRSVPGGMLFGLNLAVWFTALEHASVGIATVTSALTPVLAMAAGSRLLGERITRLAVLCAAGAIGGVTLFVVPGFSASGTTPLGMALSVLAIGIWVCYLFVTKKARAGVGTVEYLLCMSVVAAICLLPVVAVLNDDGLRPPDHGWGWLVGLALVPGCLGHGLLTWAQPHVDLSVASVLLQGEPVGAAIAGAVLLGEQILPVQAVGMIIAFIALAVLARQTATEPTPDLAT